MVLLKLGGRAGIDQGIKLVTFGNANGLAVGHGRLSMAAPDSLHGCRAMACGRAQSGNRDNATIRPEARQHEKPAVSSQDEAGRPRSKGVDRASIRTTAAARLPATVIPCVGAFSQICGAASATAPKLHRAQLLAQLRPV